MAGEETNETLQQEVIETDFKERTVRKITVSEDTKPAKFFRDAAKLSKDTGVRSVMALTVDSKDHVDWAFQISTDADIALICLALEYARDDLKAKLFKEEDEV